MSSGENDNKILPGVFHLKIDFTAVLFSNTGNGAHFTINKPHDDIFHQFNRIFTSQAIKIDL
jgi:hypothetical protein